VRLVHADARLALGQALVDAAERLARPACTGILGEFKDAAGRTLEENLARHATDAPAYLETIFFYDGEREKRCAEKDVVALTEPGSRVVKVCRGFSKRWRLERAETEATLIHEALHTLGLGENPPSSREITERVLGRCFTRSSQQRRPLPRRRRQGIGRFFSRRAAAPTRCSHRSGGGEAPGRARGGRTTNWRTARG
jgi:hypothetical protein